MNKYLIIYYFITLVVVIGGSAVGVVKLMAWWQVAMNGCAS